VTKAGTRQLRIAPRPEDRLVRRDRLRIGLAFGGAVLLHASTALSFVYWNPADPVAPPGDMIITFDLEAAALSDAQADQAGVAEESAPEAPQPPAPAEEELKEEEEVVEEPEPEPVPELKEEIVEVPKAEEAEVVIAPKKEKKEKKKPKPKPVVQSQAAAAPAIKKSDVSGIGASASPSEINAYAGRVRAAIERKKNKPAGAGNASGTAHLAFTITSSGGIVGLRLSRSSGNSALDGAARAAVASAGIPPIPPGLPTPMNFGVPINFR
jgi:protein TonB